MFLCQIVVKIIELFGISLVYFRGLRLDFIFCSCVPGDGEYRELLKCVFLSGVAHYPVNSPFTLWNHTSMFTYPGILLGVIMNRCGGLSRR